MKFRVWGMLIFLVGGILATGLAAEAQEKKEAKETSKTVKERSVGSESAEDPSCSEYRFEIRELDSKADLAIHKGRDCQAYNLMRKALNKAKNPPRVCRNDPGWNSIMLDWQVHADKKYQQLRKACSSGKAD